jgi:hypothetical protein
VESRTHLEITCRPFCFVFCFQISQPSRSFSTPKFRQFTTLCNSCRPAACAHAVVDVYAVIISAFATLVDHSSAESSSGSNQYGGKKNVDAAGHKKKSISVTPSRRRRVVKRKLVLISALFLRFYDRTLSSLLSLTISEASTVCSVCVVPGPLLHLRRECLV